MALAGEAGSLLRIEEEIRSAIDEASTIARSQPVLRQAALFPGDEKRKPKQLELQGLVAEHFWLKAEQRIYDALKTYAEEAESGSGFQRRLFADDAAQGFAFIDLCRKRYEVVVMNPPYGLASQGSDSWVREQYSRSCNDLYGAFSERAFGLTASCRGFVGALTSKTFLYSKQLHGSRDRLREDEHRLLLLIDLGAGVLDAAVETSSWVVGPKITPLTTFWDYTKEDKDTLSNRFLSLLYEPQCSLRRLLAIEQFDVLPFGVFSYWCPFEILRAVADLKPFEPEYGQAVQGLKTFDDFRFIRLCWELQYGDKLDGNWRYIAKGGGWSRYHSEAAVVMDWRSNGEIPRQNELRRYGTDARSKQSISFWGRRGLTFSEVSSLGFSAQPQQEGNLFGGCGFCIFVKEQESLAFWLAFFNSRPVFSLLSMFSTDRHWNAGMVARLPIPDLTGVFERLSSLGRDQFALARKDGESSETAIEFICPNFKEEIRSIGKFNENQTEIDAIVTTAYGFREESLVSLEVKYPIPSHRSEAAPILGIADLISYALGAAFGRWDIRFATGEKPAPELPEPFEPLSVCPPGMLQNGQGLPLTQGEVERLSAADQWCYPLKVPWDGILVDDPEDEMDIVRHVRESLNLIWRERAETIEQEASESLNASDIGEYFRKPVKFFADHQKRYSKNRRQAPIYWPLSTAGGRYTLWLYYHRLTPDTLYKCLQLFVVPKLADVEKELAHLRTILAENEGGANERNRLEELESLRSELIELRTELELWAPKWKPNLNDGVIITAAPLWRLFRLPKWQKDLKACWQELEKGDYDWAHLAYSLWPDRVREKCKTDRSLAIAHGLEEICEVKAPVKKLKKSKKTTMKDDLQEYFEG
jgi:hypothetical protein